MVIEIKTDKPYEVIVEDGVLDRAGEKIAPLVRPGSRAMIVSETNVFPIYGCLLYTSPSPRDPKTSRMPSSA